MVPPPFALKRQEGPGRTGPFSLNLTAESGQPEGQHLPPLQNHSFMFQYIPKIGLSLIVPPNFAVANRMHRRDVGRM